MFILFYFYLIFFFQAEDGIRDRLVTGVQTCALPILGVEILTTAEALTEASDVIVKVRPPSAAEVNRLSSSMTLISFFHPDANEALMELAKSKEASVIAMDMVPRISRAQKNGRPILYGQYCRLSSRD